MAEPTIRPARSDEYDEVARVWMNSWASTGIEETSNFLLAKLRARIALEVEKGWSLFVANDGAALAAMLALHLPHRYLDQLFVAPQYQRQNLGRRLLASQGSICQMKSTCAACAKMRTHGAGTSARASCSKRKRSSR
jgi:GNAT superfamily N-acetyltransferase